MDAATGNRAVGAAFDIVAVFLTEGGAADAVADAVIDELDAEPALVPLVLGALGELCAQAIEYVGASRGQDPNELLAQLRAAS